MALRARNALLTAKIESSEETDASPSASTDAVLVENLRISIDPNVIQTNEHTSSLDGAGPIVAGTRINMAFDVYMKGSGTGGTAAEVGKLLKACGMAETLTSTAVPAAAEACAAGTTTTATLAASATGTAQLYRGMPLVISGSNTAANGTYLISDYTSGKVATITDTAGAAISTSNDYQIPTNARYAPASSSIPTLTMDGYMDGLKYKMVGSRGNCSWSMDTAGVVKFSFAFSGIYSSKTDVALPAATFESSRPPAFINAVAKYNRTAVAIGSLRFDLGNTLAYPPNPNKAHGYDAPIITGRRPTLSIDPSHTLVATRDVLADVLANTTRIIAVRLGTASGNRIGLTVPQFQPLNEAPGDRDGILTAEIPGEAVGADAGFFLTFW